MSSLNSSAPAPPINPGSPLPPPPPDVTPHVVGESKDYHQNEDEKISTTNNTPTTQEEFKVFEERSRTSMSWPAEDRQTVEQLFQPVEQLFQPPDPVERLRHNGEEPRAEPRTEPRAEPRAERRLVAPRPRNRRVRHDNANNNNNNNNNNNKRRCCCHIEYLCAPCILLQCCCRKLYKSRLCAPLQREPVLRGICSWLTCLLMFTSPLVLLAGMIALWFNRHELWPSMSLWLVVLPMFCLFLFFIGKMILRLW